MFRDTLQDEDMDNVELSDDSDSERQLYNPGQPGKESEVFSFQNKDDEDSDENEQISTDVHIDIPDTRAWGKKKKAYYSSDYVDADLGILTEKDEKNAEIEEEEAKNIQNRLAKELDDVDFGLDVTTLTSQIESKINTSHIIKIDMSKFTSRQKLELLEKESPELVILIQDIKDQLAEVKTTLGPYLKLIKEENYTNNAAFMFVQTKYQAVLHYCVNILFYLTLKSKRLLINPHPVIKRLAQYRQLLNQLNSLQGNILHNLQKMLKSSENRKSLPVSQMKFENTGRVIADQKLEEKMYSEHNKNEKSIEERNTMEETEVTSIDNMNTNESNASVERRLITYQISKNKGLTPHRNKEQRNPRVKHRMKYRKAKIRRKGAVREARKEIYRYAGEISGIKVGLKKSVSLK